jgi:hypothetical protein
MDRDLSGIGAGVVAAAIGILLMGGLTIFAFSSISISIGLLFAVLTGALVWILHLVSPASLKALKQFVLMFRD